MEFVVPNGVPVDGVLSGMARRLDHVAVAVRDADSAARWYVDYLGMEMVSDESVPAAGVRLVYLATRSAGGGQATLQLVQPVTPGPVASFVRDRGEGLHHICFAVDDIADAVVLLGEGNVPLVQGGGGRRTCFLTSQPNNALIELTETEPVSEPIPWLADGHPHSINGRPVDQS